MGLFDKKSESGAPSPLLAKIEAIGASVNPPEEEEVQEEEVQEEEIQEEEKEVQEEEVQEEEIQEEEKEVQTHSGTCEYCGKFYTVLKRHKCKMKPKKEMIESISPSSNGFDLYIDVAIVKASDYESFTHFFSLIQPLLDQIKEHGAEHWGLIEYGKGGPTLATVLDDYLTNNKDKLPQAILCSSISAEFRACEQVLKAHAFNIFQGLR